MKLSIRENDVWIPEWNGNRELPADEQVRFHHRFLRTDERKKYVYIEDPTLEDAASGDVSRRKIHSDGEGIARAIITKIEGLIIEKGGTETAIDTIEKFYSGPDAYTSLRAELEGYCLTLSARADSKN